MAGSVNALVRKTAKRILGQNGIEKLRALSASVESRKPGNKPAMVDVCFINGCAPSVPHPPRYRVTHQRQQLEAFGVSTSEVFYTKVTEDTVRFAQMFIIFRCPYTEQIGRLIERAHQENKKVYFDVDDLVIDTRYTDHIPYVQTLKPEEKALYDDGVKRMGKTLSLCDGAITTTAALAKELKHYVPEVIVNRNTASEEMVRYSEDAIRALSLNHEKEIFVGRTKTSIPVRQEGQIRIGYFSGSITHNADVQLIMPALCHILEKYPQVVFYAVGEMELPEELQAYASQIRLFPFVDWKMLPHLIAAVDINLAPIQDNTFNRAKSENKWVEAALVHRVTLASNVGAFAEMIEDGKTGYLCDESEEDWIKKLSRLIEHAPLRERMANNAYDYVKANCVTICSGGKIADLVTQLTQKRAAFVVPGTAISGGMMVALRHAQFLREEGYVVTFFAQKSKERELTFLDDTFSVVPYPETEVKAAFDLAVASMWTTTEFLMKETTIRRKYYLVQNYETDFYTAGDSYRIKANRTYRLPKNEVRYVTISKWCQNWLRDRFDREASYAPNGLDCMAFPFHDRENLKEIYQSGSRKIRILIEGDSAAEHKGVDESFRIANRLDPQKFEIRYMSYNEQPKSWYRVDRFLHQVPYAEVGSVYGECDILLKSSRLESFSYPPLEMMATGGYVVAVPNDGNREYLIDEENCLFYRQGDEDAGLACIMRFVEEPALCEKIRGSYQELLGSRDWSNVKSQVLELYKE